MVKALINGLGALCTQNDNVIFLIADDKEVYDGLYERCPDRTINIGISECNAISMGAGMASCGLVPYVIGGNAFMAYRAYEFVRNQICMQNRNVKIVGIGAGLAISVLGNTQHATEDIGALRILPNLEIMTPATPTEVHQTIKHSICITTPLFIRVGRAEKEDFYQGNTVFSPYEIQEVRKGREIAVFAIGSIVCDVLEAAAILSEKGIEIGVINVHTIKPLDKNGIIDISKRYDKWLSVEENNIIGGIGSALSELITDKELKVKLRKMGLESFARGYGSYHDIKSTNYLGVCDIINMCLALLKESEGSLQ